MLDIPHLPPFRTFLVQTPIRKETTMLRITLRYTRYVLASLASVGFGIAFN
jgi:hypothetical protein